jgi:hypothetical protein
LRPLARVGARDHEDGALLARGVAVHRLRAVGGAVKEDEGAPAAAGAAESFWEAASTPLALPLATKA